MKAIRIAAIALTIGLTAAQASAQTCGDGLVTGGEACDVANTVSGTDECGDGCGDDCTLLEECGVAACEDGADNDGDGLTDTEDPECATLLELQPLAVVGTNPVSRGMRMGLMAEVRSCDALGNCGLASGRTLDTVAPYPFGDSKADVCATQMKMQHAIIEGSLTILDSALFLGPEGFSGFGPFYVADNGMLPEMRDGFPPQVGLPVGLCLDGVTPCLVDDHCPPPIGCENRLALDDPMNTAVDLLGTGVGAPLLANCNTALAALNDLAAEVASLGDGSDPDIKVKRKQALALPPLAPGPNVFNFGQVRLGRQAQLTINGPADSSFVAVVSRRLKLGRDADIVLTGGIEARNVLFTFVGDRGAIAIGREATAAGTMLAPGRPLLRMGWESELDGALFGRSVELKERSRLHHTPFTGLLPTNLEVVKTDSPDPVTAGTQLTYTLTVRNNGIAWAPAVTLTDTLDADVDFVSVSSSQGSCVHDGSATGGVVTCFLGSLADSDSAPADEATITITVDVHCDARGSLSNTATVTAETAELNPADNTIVETTTITEDAVLAVSISDSIDPVEELTGLEYTITVQNTGVSSCSRSVSIADALPAGLVGETVSIAPGSVPGCPAHLTCTASCPGNAFPCAVTNLPAGQMVTIQVTGGTVADGTSILGNTAEFGNSVAALSVDGNGSDLELTDVVRNQGDSCAGGTGTDCITSSCVDGFCCGGACGGTCEACNVGGSEGTCTGIAANTDPVNECGSLCSVCDGNGGAGGGACTPATDGSDPNNECAAAAQDTCDFDGQCDGAGACRFYAAGTACLNQADTACSDPNTCDGTGTCLENHEPLTTPCTGSSQGGVCDDDAADHCAGTSDSCVDEYQLASVTCRSDSGQCDVAELCTGASGACPADAFEPNTTPCTGSSQGGVCDDDAADVCSGTADTCVDAYEAASFVCRSATGQCDVAEQCTGASGSCPVDAFEPNTTPCTGSSQGDVCDDDAADVCSGTADTCVDAFQAASVVCRTDAGECDVEELCTGAAGACPADAFEPNATPCTGGACDGAGMCLP